MPDNLCNQRGPVAEREQFPALKELISLDEFINLTFNAVLDATATDKSVCAAPKKETLQVTK